ncbi:MAG: enoyl-CoA hydratase [Alcaligenaceae bacterium]|nr:enoyl-CoA hydratase [Alcaligenaceae bacterium]
MTDKDLLFEVSGAVARITFNRPHVHNSASFAMYTELESVCERIAADSSIRVVTFRGAGGKAFVAGTDISEFRDFATEHDALKYEKRIEKIVGAVESLDCTTIAVLDGVCAGGGAAIALACDFRYSNEALRFGVPVAKTLGNCLAISNVARMVDLIGVARTKEILMLARFLDAETCKRLGVVNDTFTDDALEQGVADVIDRLLSLAPLTLRASKIAIRRTLAARRAPADGSDDLVRLCYASTDFHEAVEAFLEKKSYTWQGR